MAAASVAMTLHAVFIAFPLRSYAE